jgi:4-amino-4-deoxy-L-arabinose transferase-like glycosyltransferase
LVYCGEYFPFCGPDNQLTASVEPLPVLLFAGFMWLFGPATGAVVAVVAQNVLGVLTAVILYHILQHLFHNPATSLIGTFLWATYLPMITLTLYLEAEIIFTCCLLLAIWALLHSLATNNKLTWVAVGLCWGLATLSRSIVLYFPFILLCIALAHRPTIRRHLVGIALALLAFALTLTPWVVRNAQVFGVFLPGNTLLGYNLYRHNYFLGDEAFLHYGYAKDAAPVISHLVANAPALRGNENEVAMDAFYKQEALKIIKAHPVRYGLLSLYRLGALWTDFEIQQGQLFWQIIALENIALLLLAALTAFRHLRTSPRNLIPIVLLIAYFAATHSLVNARMRYIMPILPLVMALAAAEAVRWLKQIGQRLPRRQIAIKNLL